MRKKSGLLDYLVTCTASIRDGTVVRNTLAPIPKPPAEPPPEPLPEDEPLPGEDPFPRPPVELPPVAPDEMPPPAA